MFDDLADINVFMTVMAIIGGVAQLIFLANFFISIYRGQKATKNPWNSNTIEWTTPVEHIHGNWPGKIPEVHRWAYDYSKKVDPDMNSWSAAWLKFERNLIYSFLMPVS